MESSTKNSKTAQGLHRGTMIVYFLGFCCFLFGCSQQFILGVPSLVAQDLGVTISDVGLMVTAFGLCNALFAPFLLVGLLRFGQRVQLLAGLSLMATGMLVTAFVPSYSALMVCRGIMGVGNGTFVATAYVVAANFAKPGKEASSMANIAFGFSASQVLAMPVARIATAWITWQELYLFLGAVACIAIAVIVKVMPSRKPETAGMGIKERFAPLANPLIALALGVIALVFGSFAVLYTYITPFLEETIPDVSAVATVLFLLGLMSLVGTKGSGFLADRIGVFATLLIGLSINACALAGVALLCGLGWIVCLPLAFFILAAWAFLPSQNLVLRRIAKHQADTAISLGNSFLQLGNSLGAAIGGFVLPLAGVIRLPIVGFLLTAAALAFEVFLISRVRKES